MVELVSGSLLWGEVAATHNLAETQTHGHRQIDAAQRSWVKGTREKSWQKSGKTPPWSFRLSAPSIPIKPTDKHLSLQLVGEQGHRDSICCCPPTGTPAQSHSMATSLWNLHQSVTLSELLCRKPFTLSTQHTPLLSFQIQLSNKLSQTSPIFFQKKACKSFAFVSCHPTSSSR